MKAVILAGGMGTRLRPVTGDRPKPMVPLLGKPLMEHIIALLRTQGFDDICAALRYRAGDIMAHFGDGSRFGVHMQYRLEQEALGTAGAVKNCGDFCGDEDVLVISGDAACDFDLAALMAEHKRRQAAVTLALYRHPEPLRYGLVMDEIYNLMESGEAAVAAYYVGDYFTMVDAQAESVDLQCFVPEVTNYFVDAMCIPSCCQNKELAEIFINYMLSAEPAIANAEYIYYASPNSLVYNDAGYQEELGEEAMAILYPEIGDFSQYYNKYAFRNLDSETLDYLNTLWEALKIS